jgi:hypothetical protein
MTEGERRQQNWVELRAACTVQGTFEQIADTIERDVERFNKLPAQKRQDRKFKCSRQELSVISVNDVDDAGEITSRMGIHVQKNSLKIRARRGYDLLFEIEHEWNERTLACDLKIDGEFYSVWQISQKAIGDLLFGYD